MSEAVSRDIIDHLAFSIVHGTFIEPQLGGCGCELCQGLLVAIKKLKDEEAAAFYNGRYPPPGRIY